MTNSAQIGQTDHVAPAFYRDPEAREQWTEDPIDAPAPGFELCYECDGKKLCPEEPHPYCRGWCHVCGGAGQWPLDPETKWWTPSVPLIDVEARAKQRNIHSPSPNPEAPRQTENDRPPTPPAPPKGMMAGLRARLNKFREAAAQRMGRRSKPS